MNEKYLYEYSNTGHYTIAVCYPNSYHVGMSNLGFLSLFHFLSSTDGIKVDRYFFERDGKLISFETNPLKNYLKSWKKSDLSYYDAIFFSVSFEMDYFNIIKMLELSGINSASDRRDDSNPIIITGGIAVTANPGPISVISDVVYLGDMEISLENILKVLLEHKFRKSIKMLSDISKLQGVYVRGISTNIPERATENGIKTPAHSVVITNKTVFANRFLVEVARGCRNSCRFCMTRTSNFPPRSISKDAILYVIKRAKNYAKLIGLIAPVVNDNPDLIEIVNEANKLGMLASFSSLRADRFTEEMAKIIKINKQRSITFAPETGSDKLRRLIGKQLTNNQILSSVELGIKYGIKNIRYYFMYGLPFEKWDDIEAIVLLVEKTLRIIGKKGNLHLSINPFVPKKRTPFENENIQDISYYKNVNNYITESLKVLNLNNNLAVRFESLKLIYTHFFLSIGNERIGKYIIENSTIKGVNSIERDFRKLYRDGVNPDEY